jgi:hypothetical protein
LITRPFIIHYYFKEKIFSLIHFRSKLIICQ